LRTDTLRMYYRSRHQYAARGKVMLRVCFAIFALAISSIPANAETPSTKEETQYGLSLRRQISRAGRYPPDARKRHEIGMVVVKLVVDPNGRLVDSRIIRSSCFDDLDQEALANVRAQAFPSFPPTIRKSQLEFKQPFVFAQNVMEGLTVQMRADCKPPAQPASAPAPSKPPTPPLLSPPPS
jgi:TonB family protein